MMSDVPVDGWVLSQTEYETLMASVAENVRLRADLERYTALESAAQRVMICTNWMTRNDRDYLVDKAAINAIKTALAALDAGERERAR